MHNFSKNGMNAAADAAASVDPLRPCETRETTHFIKLRRALRQTMQKKIKKKKISFCSSRHKQCNSELWLGRFSTTLFRRFPKRRREIICCIKSRSSCKMSPSLFLFVKKKKNTLKLTKKKSCVLPARTRFHRSEEAKEQKFGGFYWPGTWCSGRLYVCMLCSRLGSTAFLLTTGEKNQ